WVALSLGLRRPVEARVRSPRLQAAAGIIAALVLLQVAAGAFVAGLGAGAGWNTWPLMDGALIPQGLGALSPWWLNLFENALTVQFNHRLLAYAIAAGVFWHLWALRRRPAGQEVLRSAAVLTRAAPVQAGPGMWRLAGHVPVPLGVPAQAGAV